METQLRRQPFKTGISGINFEDSQVAKHAIYTTDEQCRRIEVIKNTAEKAGADIFINARIDVLLYRQRNADEEGLADIITRANAYLQAGAEGIFPIFIHKENDIHTVLDNIKAPVNLIAMPGISDMNTLDQMGVARLSLGPALMNIAVARIKEACGNFKNYQGLGELINCPVTFRHLNQLITKSEQLVN